MFGFGELLPYTLTLLKALGLSVQITLIAAVISSVIGIFLYLGRVGTSKLLSILSIAYIEVFRNTPLLVQLYLIYMGLPLVGIYLDAYTSALIAMILNNSGYMAEIYRGGFEAVPRGLREAGAVLGLGRMQIFRYVMFMPAIRSIFPAAINQYILLFLASSVASIISLDELTNTILNINSQTYLTMRIFAVAGILYFATSTILARAAGFAEKRLFRWPITG